MATRGLSLTEMYTRVLTRLFREAPQNSICTLESENCRAYFVSLNTRDKPSPAKAADNSATATDHGLYHDQPRFPWPYGLVA